MYEVIEKKTGKHFHCIPQMIDLNFNGRYVLRYNIVIKGYCECHFIEAVYDNDDFNERYKVL